MGQSGVRNSVASVYKLAFWAAVATLVIIPMQIAVFAAFPIPTTVEAWFAQFAANPLVGLFHADFFIMVDNVLIAVIYLAFYHSLKETDKGLLQVAVVLGLVGIAAYISSNRTFELLALSRKYGAAATEGERLVLLGAGQAMLAGWQGTAFDAYYVLNGVCLLVVAFLMRRGGPYGKTTAAFGLAAGVLMTIPSTAGTLGLVFSLLSLIPWYVFTIRFALVFKRLAKEAA